MLENALDDNDDNYAVAYCVCGRRLIGEGPVHQCVLVCCRVLMKA